MTILVGVDGSAASMDAVELATREAIWRAESLRIVHAFAWPYMHVPLGPSEVGPPQGGLRNAAEQIVADAAERANAVLKELSDSESGVAISADVVDGFATATLLAEGRNASMVVVGDRGLGGFTGLLIGSVAVQLATHASRPVLIQRGRPSPSGPIVVGVDGTPANTAAIEFAFAEASIRNAPLTALMAWSRPVVRRRPGEMLPLVYDADIVEDEARQTLSAAIAESRSAHADVLVAEQLAHGRARRCLVDVTAEAQLIVAGSRGRGAAEGLILGSVSQTVLRHSQCPVAIVPDSQATAMDD